MAGIATINGANDEFKLNTRFHHFKHRLLCVSKPREGTIESDATKQKSTRVMSRRKRAFLLAKQCAYRMKNILMRKLKAMLPDFKDKNYIYLGINWVPLYTPLYRRIETFAAFCCAFSVILLPGFAYLCLYYLLYSPLWWLGLVYIVYLLNDDVANHGGRRWEDYRKWDKHAYLIKYFPIKLVKTAPLNPTKNYIAPTCPYGRLGAKITFGTNGADFDTTFPGLKSHIAMIPGLFKVPFLRELNLAMGGISDSSESLMYLMDKKQKGNFVCLTLGDTSEVMVTKPDVYNVIVKDKREYARIALKTGASIVPVFCFGETRAYKTILFKEDTWMRRLQDKMFALTGFMLFACKGRGVFQYDYGIVPYRTPITVVVGEPIAVKQKHEPTEDEVEAVHKIYMHKLVHLFETNKHKYERDTNIKLVLM